MVGAPAGDLHLGGGRGRLGVKPVVMVAVLRNELAFPRQWRKGFHIRSVRTATLHADVAILLVAD